MLAAAPRRLLSEDERKSYRVSCYGSGTMMRRRSGRENELLTDLRAARQAAGLSMRELSGRLKRSHNFVTLVESDTRVLSVLEFLDGVSRAC